MGDLTENFSAKEFNCPCCGMNNLKPKFVWKLQDAKDWLKAQGIMMPFVILSGCRCEKHNKDIDGGPDSSHLTGWAADIKCSDSGARYWLLAGLRMVGFRRYGVDGKRGFIHGDLDPDKAQNVLWVYP